MTYHQQCSCGLSTEQEPSISLRSDGYYRCNDCERSEGVFAKNPRFYNAHVGRWEALYNRAEAIATDALKQRDEAQQVAAKAVAGRDDAKQEARVLARVLAERETELRRVKEWLCERNAMLDAAHARAEREATAALEELNKVKAQATRLLDTVNGLRAGFGLSKLRFFGDE
jgi:hypothetical protein